MKIEVNWNETLGNLDKTIEELTELRDLLYLISISGQFAPVKGQKSLEEFSDEEKKEEE
tara:strand:+ start:2719 stop:2895 length:177 start_codon:yes stop_codon:yes gene_type:complete